MQIRIVSDFHAEFWLGHGDLSDFPDLVYRYLPDQPHDKETILVCAGDMGVYAKFDTYQFLFGLLSPRFRQVIMVPGNHSYYHSSVWGHEEIFWQSYYLPENVAYLDNDVITVDDVTFVCSCLWTDFVGCNPWSMEEAALRMNDYRLICVEGEHGLRTTLTPQMTVERHFQSVAFIRDALAQHQGNKCVVITHHAPSKRSVGLQYRGDSLNPAFFSDLSPLILQYQPLAWIHGHMHDSKRYKIGKTEIICNPLGYHPNGINRNFDPLLVVEI